MDDQLTSDFPEASPGIGPDPAAARAGILDGDVATNGNALEGALGRAPLASLLHIASEISGQVNAILDPDELLNTVIPLLKEGFSLYYAHVYVLDEASRELRLRAGYGEAGQEMLRRGHRIPLDAERSLVARAARTREPVVVNDVRSNPAFLPNLLLPDTRAEVALPMVVGDRVLGVFDIQDDVVGAFPPVQVDVFFTLVGQIATALQNAQYVDRIAQNLLETQTRYEVGQALAIPETQDEVLDAMLAEAQAVEDMAVAIVTVDRNVEQPTLVVERVAVNNSAVDLPGLALDSRTVAESSSYYGPVADAASFYAPDVAEDARLAPDFRAELVAHGVASLLVQRLISGDETFGLLVGASGEVAAFSEALVLRYEVLGAQGSLALQQARMRDDLSLTQFSVDHAPAAIFWIRPDGSFHTVNETACELLGYARAELLALPSIGALDPNMIPNVWAVHWRRVKQDRRFVLETEYRTKDGRLIPMEVTANYLAYGDQEFNCIFARDISERKQAEVARERFTVQLRTAADIAEQIGAILDPDELLETVIPLMKERFDLYHTHVYTVEGDDLVLRSGYGRIGRIMVQQGHTISRHHPRSLVARAARTREAVVVEDVTTAPDFLPNMLLPNTKSEVAVPIVIGDQLLGVFDVQSDRLEAFTEADVDVFRTFSGQLANALYGAMLFGQQAATQQELRNAAETVRAIFDAMTEGILVTDMMGRITDANEAALALFGYETREDLLGHSAMELVTKSGWSRMAENLRAALDTGRGQVQEYTMLRRDGDTFDGEQSTALLWDSDGEPRGMVSITRDITERKRSAREIARFQALAENAVDAIMMADFAGQITYANPASCELFGYDPVPEAMLGKHLAHFWPDSEVATLLQEVLPAAGGAGWQGEVLQKRRDGETFEAALTFFAVQGQKGEPLSAATIIRDVSDRKAAEQELLRFTVQQRTAAEVSAQVNAILDPTKLLEAVVPLVQGRFELYHVHVYTLDRDAQELVMQVGSGEAGRKLRQMGHRIGLRQEPSLVAKAARTRETILVEDVTQAPDHLPNPLLPYTRSEIAIPLITGDRVIGVLDVQDDAPGRFTESDIDVLSTLATQIAIALRNAQYFEELQDVAARLREVDRLKSEFLANMSHELRTPLNSILGYAEVMLMGIDGDLTPDMEEDVNAIFENGQQLLRLINDILDLTKIEAGRMTLNKESLAVLPLLEQAKSHNMGLLHKHPKPVEVIVSSAPELPLIEADPVRFAQVLNNLVSNAIKFTDEGQVEIQASYNSETDRLYIDVADTGVGISEEDLVELFERFHQVDGSSTRRAEGTGLGLAISRHLVQMHGGDLSVVSELGVGSTFTIAMPVIHSDPA
ncbi:MAG: PAS domain S-box protein [Anaerolineae bacterium]|nr:PAS domain S-box protein [Anaerolineae bacterium]